MARAEVSELGPPQLCAPPSPHPGTRQPCRFETAVEEALKAILAAKVEASSAYKGIGIVKLMGRQSGFITVQASLAAGIVDAALIPEVGAGCVCRCGLCGCLGAG